MSIELRVRQLLEDALDSDQSPEEVCRESPELLEAVREQWDRLRSVEAQLEEVFPTPAPTRRDGPPLPEPRSEFPRIPGYAVEAFLGRGGMGVVYRARHLKLNRPAAIKMLLAGAYASSQDLTRFVREAEAVASLRHANIVQVHDAGDLDGLPYFAMEFVEGGSLSQKLAGAPQPAAKAVAMLVTLAEAVEVAHKGGIVHRDLKPANVLLTSDGTPKISDFGLARRVAGESSVTLTGTHVGTPSYMAPEQAEGPSGAAGPRADVYSLGAILYEMLTGRPPFRADTASETIRQVVADDPALPSRLNSKVPRDLETICLKCLHKDPARRYATAAALADDLERFQRGEPIAARRVGLVERSRKWVRRRPAPAAALAGGLLLAITLVSVGWWRVSERAATVRAVEADLNEAAKAQRRSDWVEARTAFARATARLGDRSHPELRRRLDQGNRDLEVASTLDAIRLDRAAIVGGHHDISVNNSQADREYERAFVDAGAGELFSDPERVVEWIRTSNIREALVTAIEDWAVCASNDERRNWLLEVVRRADPDPTGVRDRLRDPTTWKDRTALTELARTAREAKPSVQLLVAIGERLRDLGGDAIQFLTQVQREYPGDFWANFTLGDLLWEKSPAEAVRYLQAALALRPDAAVAHHNLGRALALSNRLDEAIACFRQAVSIDPTFAHAYSNLGNALTMRGRHAEAIEQHQQALRLGPTSHSVRANLGAALVQAGRIDEAFEQLQEALRLNSKYPVALTNFGFVLQKKDRLDEAIEHHREALRIDPDNAAAHNNLGLALAAMGQTREAIEHYRGRTIQLEPSDPLAYANLGKCLSIDDHTTEAIDAFRNALRLDPEFATAHTGLGNALAKAGKQNEAVEHFRDAARLDPGNLRTHFNLGLALGRAGSPDQAISSFEEAIRIDPTFADAHGALGLALVDDGRIREGKDALERCIGRLSKSDTRRRAFNQEVQKCLGLLALEVRLPAILDGTKMPANEAEHVQFAELCQLKKRYFAAVNLFTKVFAVKPHWADDLKAAARYSAARCAAMAGCGLGQDGAMLNEAERTRLRKQSREWLRADLAAWTGSLDGDSQAARDRVRIILTAWQTDRALAGVRERKALEEFPADERKECLALWKDIAALLKRAQELE